MRAATRFCLAGLLAWTTGGVSAAVGDVFELVGGGRVVGDLLNPDESPRTTFEIQTASGGKVTLAADQVKRRVPQSPVQREYEQVRLAHPDTVEGQWAVAEWCRERILSAQRETHLRRIIELDPDHRGARAALGYSRIDGKWQTQDEVMRGRGLERYKGSWKTPQEIRAIQRREEKKEVQGKWLADVRRLSGWLGGSRTEEARQAIEAINDPMAVPALATHLREDRRRAAQALYAAALARIGSHDAVEALAISAIEDPDEEVRLTCLDHLKKARHPRVIEYFCGRLRDKNNVIVNRAARALREMNDASAVAPLIDALITAHKHKVTTGPPGQTSATFGNVPGGGGFTTGSKVTIVTEHVRNQAVLDALIALTGGVNFDFDVAAWKSWHASRSRPAPLDARRG
ncbi:MAG: HEAT repeat domain-containing protein [Pirellulales bacterium]|nr:HEAT repeat domain-containing protein [Pirellulales bacterium]